MQNVQQKLEAFLAQENEQKERAQRCFVSYLRSVYLMKNKEVFDVFKLQIQEYAVSLGLAVAPRVRFLSKAQARRAEKEAQQEEEQSKEEEEVRSFKAQLKGNNRREESQSSDSEDSVDDEESGNEGEMDESKTLLLVADGIEDDDDDDDDDDDLRDLDLLTVKRKDIFNLTEDEETLNEVVKKKMDKQTKFKEAKKVLKRNFQVNTKVAFSEEGEALQVWPPVQRAVTGTEEEDEEEDVSGINVEKARERLRHEDQEFDKQEYSRKVKAKHRERRLKAKAARREASKRPGQKSDEDTEDEVVAYVANHSEDEFDPSTLPDPDKLHLSEEEEEEEEEEEMITSDKRQHSSESSDEEEGVLTAGKKKKARQQNNEHAALDTGLSLAEDEELVLHLLAGQR
ncbi:hypothetical protein ABVT39_024130 [Epinephelus coioides]